MKHLPGAGEEEKRDPTWNNDSTHPGKQRATTDSGKENQWRSQAIYCN
jgi:hypothetical protein